MRILFLILYVCFFTISGITQNKYAFTLFNSKGKTVSYEKMLESLKNADIVLFGELHNNPISHWLQYEVSIDLINYQKVILGAEMFEADNQDVLNKYLGGEIDQKDLDTLARLWPNYKTDYAPLVNLARDKQLKFIATNIPRRYANMVYKKGFEVLDVLSAEEKSWIAPLPIEYDPELPGYKKMLSMMGAHGGDLTPAEKLGLPKAQAIKDATMAYFIIQNYNKNYTFIHFHGTYHTDNYEGILWYLKKLNPKLKYITISTVSQDNPTVLLDTNKGKADFIICVDENMTTTY